MIYLLVPLAILLVRLVMRLMSDHGLAAPPATFVSGTHTDDGGNALVSSAVEGDGSGGFGPAIRRWITAGVYNGDFVLAPPSADAAITSDNALPYWTFTQGTGTGAEFTSVADSTNPSGRVLRLRMNPGAVGDGASLSQLIGVNGANGRNYVYGAKITTRTPTISNAFAASLTTQYYKADGTTATGVTTTNSALFSAIATTSDISTISAIAANIPSDAYYLKLSIGLGRNGAATTDTGYVDVTEVRLYTGPDHIILADQSGSGTNTPVQIYKTGGVTTIDAGSNASIKGNLSFAGQFTAPPATITISAAGTSLSSGNGITSLFLDVTVSGGPFTMTSAPTIGDATDGQLLIVTNVSGNAITLQDQGTLASSNLRLSTTTYALSPRDSITLRYSSVVGDWIEIARTNVL